MKHISIQALLVLSIAGCYGGGPIIEDGPHLADGDLASAGSASMPSIEIVPQPSPVVVPQPSPVVHTDTVIETKSTNSESVDAGVVDPPLVVTPVDAGSSTVTSPPVVIVPPPVVVTPPVVVDPPPVVIVPPPVVVDPPPVVIVPPVIVDAGSSPPALTCNVHLLDWFTTNTLVDTYSDEWFQLENGTFTDDHCSFSGIIKWSHKDPTTSSWVSTGFFNNPDTVFVLNFGSAGNVISFSAGECYPVDSDVTGTTYTNVGDLVTSPEYNLHECLVDFVNSHSFNVQNLFHGHWDDVQNRPVSDTPVTPPLGF